MRVHLFLFFLTFLNIFLVVEGQFPKKEKYVAVKEDVPFIRCETCQKAVKFLFHKTNEMRDKAPAKQLEEEKVIEYVEKSCNPDTDEGDWISKFDLVEKDKSLKLQEKDSFGTCRRECRTISKACEESVAEVDTDIGELLWKNKLSLSKLINEVCYSLSSVCNKKPPKLAKGKRKLDEVFQPMTEDERKAQQVMRKMQGKPGMPGMEMYSREDMEKMQKQMEGKMDEDDPLEKTNQSFGGGEDVGFIQTVADAFKRFWAWLKSLFGFDKSKSDEL